MIEAREIEDALLGFVQREIFAPEVAVTSQTDLIAAGFDSMSLVRVLLFVERHYGLWIPEGEINSTTLRSIGSLAETVSRLLHAK
jgi:acyl carrier protein